MSAARRVLLALVWVAAASPASAQSIRTYTESTASPDTRVLGYPVPQPVVSLTPVDGFRDYASLDARLRALDLDSTDLLGHDVGTTRNGRAVRAYVVSDGDGVDVEGRPEAAFFINASTHAREWATPEVSTYLVERLIEGAEDQGLVRYLLDNTRLVIIPVHNVDGFLQTQRYPAQVVVGKDPRYPGDWPRDGRMRRKNMPGVDEVLSSFGDHLKGVDLNRNHPPFWGSTTLGGELTDPDDLTYRGTAAHSEPENVALEQAAALAPVTRIRLGIDLHTFSQVFYSSNTGRSRLNAIQNRLIALLAAHHRSVPTAGGSANAVSYANVPDPPNSGIGAAAEYFAYQWLVPAWTLELEPRSSAAQYGGSNDSHGGFILPASQIRRVREAWAETHLVAFYYMAGAPFLQRLRVFDAGSGLLLQESRWEYDPASGQRQRVVEAYAPIPAGRPLRAELSFNKPMRWRNAAGAVASLPGSTITLLPRIRLLQDGQSQLLDSSGGEWLHDAGFLRYRDDTFRFDFSLEQPGAVKLQVEAVDMTGQALDADPSTPLDWSAGAWSGWEDADGNAGDLGGADASTAALDVVPAALPRVLAASSVAGEGDRLRVRLQLDAAAMQPVSVLGESLAAYLARAQSDPPPPPAAEVGWAVGEQGERELLLPLADDVETQGDREVRFDLTARIGSEAYALAALPAEIRDNDREGAVVVRVRDDLVAGLQSLSASDAAQRTLVLEGDREYAARVGETCTPFALQAPLRVFGSRARLAAGGACAIARVEGSGTLELRDLRLDATDSEAPGIDAAQSDAQLRLLRTRLIGTTGYALRSGGSVELRQSSLRDATAGTQALVAAADLAVDNSSVLRALPGQAGSGLLFDAPAAGQASDLQALSLVDAPLATLIRGPATLGNSLQQDGAGLTAPAGGACSGVDSGGGNRLERPCPGVADASDRIPLSLDLAAAVGADADMVLPVAQAIDVGGECGSVDQRGAPRPQTLVDGALPACDAGAVEQGINPWRGFWIPDRPGHGIDLQTSGNVLFLLWYTYDDSGAPTAYQAAAALSGPHWEARLQQPRRDPQDGAISLLDVGSIQLDFSSDVEARLGWRFDAHDRAGSEGLHAYEFGAGVEPRVEVTGTWFPPLEPGNGASIARRGEVTALALYYYDPGGQLRWALGTGTADDVVDIELLSYTGFCPDCDATAMPVQNQPAGRAVLQFLGPDRLRVDSAITYPGAASAWQRDRAAFVPINDPVDNRDAAAALRP